jgi:hypothetical protein
MNTLLPSIDSMLEDLRSAGWMTLDPRLAEASPDAAWTEDDLRGQWSMLQQHHAHERLVQQPLVAS